MSSMLAHRLTAARRKQFVGRGSELALFQSALDAQDLPFSVLYIFGPGGVGKTTLLLEFAARCDEAQIPALFLDARNIEPAPEALIDALRHSMGLTFPESPHEVLTSASGRHVILIDTYESLEPIEGWMRDCFLPKIPDNTLMVLASRQPLSVRWKLDAGWQALIRAVSLRNLEPQESRSYLIKRDLPLKQHQAVLDFTHGHPLALSLVADLFSERGETFLQPESDPDVIQTLLERFIRKVPGPLHRTALELCSLVRLTTESLLSAALETPDAYGLFEWLRGLSFVEAGRHGIFPHDLAREALIADLKWRNPDRYADLHHRARAYYSTRLQQTSGQEQQRILFDYIFLHRDNPVVRPFFEWQESSSVFADAIREADAPTLSRMVARHEGEEPGRVAAYWLERDSQETLVFRSAPTGSGDLPGPAGFMMMVALHRIAEEDLQADPAVRTAWNYLQKCAPLRPGEKAVLFRFWMAHDTYQAVSPTQSLIFVNAVRYYLSTPGLAYSFFACADPDFWLPVFSYADARRIHQADFEVGGRRYGVYGHDWRAVPPVAWLEMLAEKEIGGGPQAAPPRTAEPLLVLSRPEFSSAVRDALRHFSCSEELRSSPLLRSRIIVERTGAGASASERILALKSLLKKEIESLQTSPRQAKLCRALHRTYLNPAPTQEQAAEILDLPFSTYRRHLTAGVDRIIELLWLKEIGGLV